VALYIIFLRGALVRPENNLEPKVPDLHIETEAEVDKLVELVKKTLIN
jgi:hypothetical protein